MKKKFYFLFTSLLMSGVNAQVGINTTNPSTTLEIVAKSPASKVEGILIPKLTGDQIYNMPILQATNEGNMVYATSAASAPNQTGVGINLKTRGFFYWDGNLWVSVDKSTVTNILSLVKPMNFIYGDKNDFPEGLVAFVAPPAAALRLLNPEFGNSGAPLDYILENNPLNVQMWDNTTSTIKIPQQLKGYAITINVSLKYARTASNSSSTRIVAYTGNVITDPTGLYMSGGTKIKDVFFKQNPTSTAFDYVSDELVLSPIIITQQMLDHGIKVFVGDTGNSSTNYYEPILTVDYGVVNTSL